MNGFAKTLADRAEAYIGLRRSLGYSFRKQAATLRALVPYVEQHTLGGPLTRATALDWVLSWRACLMAAPSATALFGTLLIILRSMIRGPKHLTPRRCRGPAQFRRLAY